MFVLLGIILMWIVVAGVPLENQVRLVEGDVTESHVVNDRYGKATHVEFHLSGNALSYWTDRLPEELIRPHVPADPVHLQFYAEFDGAQPKRTLAGTVKTYGLTVNGREVISLGDRLEGERLFLIWMVLPVSIIFLGIGGGMWLYQSKKPVSD
jgi:hypothetical protein